MWPSHTPFGVPSPPRGWRGGQEDSCRAEHDLYVSVPQIPHDRARRCPALRPGVPPTPVQLRSGTGGAQQQAVRRTRATVASPWQLGGKRVRGSEAGASFSVAHSDHVLSGVGFPVLTGAVCVDSFPPVAGEVSGARTTPACRRACPLSSTAPSTPTPPPFWLWPPSPDAGLDLAPRIERPALPYPPSVPQQPLVLYLPGSARPRPPA